jgi:outer membrane protein insertion porin family
MFVGGAFLMAPATPAVAQDSLLLRPLVRGLSFDGNHAIDDYTLGASIATTNSSWWVRHRIVSWVGLGERRYFDEREFQRDVLRLKLLYSQAGFLDARIDTVVQRDSGSVRLQFLITEGPPVRITDITVTGTEGIVPSQRVLEALPLVVGEPFNRLLLGASTDSIRAIFEGRGYPFVEVFRGFDVRRDTREATVTFDVVPGPRSTVGRVDIVGDTSMGEGAIRRLLPVRAGRWYRWQDLADAQRELYRTGAFDYVDVRLTDSVPRADSTVTVRVAVREGKARRMRATAGYGTEDCFRLLTGLTSARLFGGLRSLDVTARLAKIGTGSPFSWGLQNTFLCQALQADNDNPERLALNYNVTASLSEPALFTRSVGATIGLSAERRSEVGAYVQEGFGASLRLTVRNRWDVPLTLSYEIGRSSTKASPATSCLYLNICRLEDIATYQAPRRKGTLGLVLARNRQNSVLNPSRGSLATAQLRWASAFTGSDSLAAFTMLQAQYARYLPLGRNAVLSFRVLGGTLLSSVITVDGVERFYVPPEERFYSGGANTVRGFGQNELGPVVRVIHTTPTDSGPVVVDTLSSASGGTDLFVANVELRVPIPGLGSRVQFATFVDAGQVFDRADALSDPGVWVTPGIGLRFETGVGPIRFDVGYNGYGAREGPLYREEGSELVLVEPIWKPDTGSFLSRLRLHFSVGQAF